MAESTIITGQFVRISQTPASIGERLLALVIDYSLIVIYLYSVTTLIVKLHLSSGVGTVFFLCLVYLPVLFYSFLCEMFNHGQSFGKRLKRFQDFLEKHPCINRADYCAITGMNKTQAIRQLNLFIEKGVIQKYGIGKTVVYIRVV